MFDLTREIPLDKSNYARYRKLQIVLYLAALVLAVYFFILIFFPTKYFLFSFAAPNAKENNIISPRNSQEQMPDQGKIKSGDALVFDTTLIGDYSEAQVEFTLNKKSNSIANTTLEVFRSHRAFFYPEAEPMGFKPGTLLKNEENYYILAQNTLRKFSSASLASSMGFNQEAFLDVSKEDLAYNPAAPEIMDASYPESSLFKVKDNYYLLENQTLRKFISPNAYRTHYFENQAIEKNEDFLAQFPQEENSIGFADGTLISYGISAYVASGTKIFPIDNVITFSSMGYDWNDIIPVSGDEISFYEKENLFNINDAHPNGTIFATDNQSQWYLIKDEKKHPLPSKNIALSWLKKRPILVSPSVSNSCTLSPGSFLNKNIYTCTIPLDKFINLIGIDYQFRINISQDTDLDTINVSFNKTANWTNFVSKTREMLGRIRNNYVPTN